MNPAVHFEMPFADVSRVAHFYEAAFGWGTQADRPTLPGAIKGGFFQRKPDRPAQHPSVVMAVEDMRAAMQRVAGSGGQVLGEPMAIPGVGQYVSFLDTEGNRVSMLQPVPRDGQPVP